MKLNNLFSALLLLAAASTAEAKPVYLQCDESKVLEDSFVINTSGKITNRTPDLNTWKNIPVFINAEAAKATVWGRAYELTATPTYYRLRSETDEVDRDLNGTRAERSRKVYEINRADLHLWHREECTANFHLRSVACCCCSAASQIPLCIWCKGFPLHG